MLSDQIPEIQTALAEADLPPEFIDRIVAAYEKRGHLTMSEDGGRYRICLVPKDRE